MKVSYMAQHLIGSEIIRIAASVNELIAKGEKICNLTIGDFEPKYFPIPEEYKNAITDAYNKGETNYPAANGIAPLRNAVSKFLSEYEKLSYSPDEILISAGARPLIYGVFVTLIDKGDTVIYPVPSWNNNHYVHITGAKGIPVDVKAENNFLPVADDFRSHLKDATLVSLCSPLNPTGTTISQEQLEGICDLIIEENKRRGEKQKPLYLLYDQIYWLLTFGEHTHFNPVSLRPEMKKYTVFIDGMSKAFASTGVRVGWAFGPKEVIERMKAILSHLGAWAPKAEQVATANFLTKNTAINNYLTLFKNKIEERLTVLYDGLINLKEEGYPVDAIVPMAAIYLTARFDLIGKMGVDGKIFKDSTDITDFLLHKAKMAVVPFYAFGASINNAWFRLSVGAVTVEEIKGVLGNLREALETLKAVEVERG
ncbi:MAG: aminotransferase [Bacteroidetes bacterium RIFCSPLOWO2_12_FULL_37_12]|nr:MAG: aminotransferase [Bacteroidetes bacterium RIFCSPLOWO2_12_FULL_37_12]